jgi:hypothetical protein
LSPHCYNGGRREPALSLKTSRPQPQNPHPDVGRAFGFRFGESREAIADAHLEERTTLSLSSIFCLRKP